MTEFSVDQHHRIVALEMAVRVAESNPDVSHRGVLELALQNYLFLSTQTTDA